MTNNSALLLEGVYTRLARTARKSLIRRALENEGRILQKELRTMYVLGMQRGLILAKKAIDRIPDKKVQGWMLARKARNAKYGN